MLLLSSIFSYRYVRHVDLYRNTRYTYYSAYWCLRAYKHELHTHTHRHNAYPCRCNSFPCPDCFIDYKKNLITLACLFRGHVKEFHWLVTYLIYWLCTWCLITYTHTRYKQTKRVQKWQTQQTMNPIYDAAEILARKHNWLHKKYVAFGGRISRRFSLCTEVIEHTFTWRPVQGLVYSNGQIRSRIRNQYSVIKYNSNTTFAHEPVMLVI